MRPPFQGSKLKSLQLCWNTLQIEPHVLFIALIIPYPCQRLDKKWSCIVKSLCVYTHQSTFMVETINCNKATQIVLVKCCLSVCATSVPSERVLSFAGYTYEASCNIDCYQKILACMLAFLPKDLWHHTITSLNIDYFTKQIGLNYYSFAPLILFLVSCTLDLLL